MCFVKLTEKQWKKCHIPPCFYAKPPDFPRLFEPRVSDTSWHNCMFIKCWYVFVTRSGNYYQSAHRKRFSGQRCFMKEVLRSMDTDLLELVISNTTSDGWNTLNWVPDIRLNLPKRCRRYKDITKQDWWEILKMYLINIIFTDSSSNEMIYMCINSNVNTMVYCHFTDYKFWSDNGGGFYSSWSISRYNWSH